MKTLFKSSSKSIFFWLTIILAPVILLCSNRVSIKLSERVYFLFESIAKLAPIAFLMNVLTIWHDENSTFLGSLYIILVFNLIIGITTHLRLNTFDIGEFFKSTLITVLVVFGVYFTLCSVKDSLPEQIVSTIYLSIIQIMTLMYPISKILRNSFILTNGKLPPKKVVEALYNYEQDGNIQKFLETFKDKSDEG